MLDLGIPGPPKDTKQWPMYQGSLVLVLWRSRLGRGVHLLCWQRPWGWQPCTNCYEPLEVSERAYLCLLSGLFRDLPVMSWDPTHQARADEVESAKGSVCFDLGGREPFCVQSFYRICPFPVQVCSWTVQAWGLMRCMVVHAVWHAVKLSLR